MALEFSANTERRLVWETEIPTTLFKRISPLFDFQNCEWRFEIRYDKNHPLYLLYMVSLSGQKLPQAFRFTSYIENGSDPLSYGTTQVTDITNSIKVIYEVYHSRNINLKSKEKIKIVMIFHDEIALTLRLPSENERFRSVAVGTNDGYSLLSSDFSKLLEGDFYHDVELQCEDQTFKAHKNVVSTRSNVFSTMLRSDMLEGQTARVEVKDMKSDVCNLLLHYMYTGNLLELTPEKASGLYEAADRYNVGGLMKQCAEFLTMNLTSNNACEMLALADAHSDPDFKGSVIEYLIDKEIPFEDDVWTPFSLIQPLLANEVWKRFFRSKNKK